MNAATANAVTNRAASARLEGKAGLGLAWKELHDGPDIVWTPRNGGDWTATRAEDINAMQLDHARFPHAMLPIPKEENHTTLVLIELDPPEHTPCRALRSPAFGPKQVMSEYLNGTTA